MTIPFIDLEAQMARIRDGVDRRIAKVLSDGNFISGPEVVEFEQALARFVGVEHVISCANGTDALQLALMALNVGPGDAVLCPSFTFAATAEAVALVGATPVFVDVDRHSFNICPASLARTLASADLDELRVVGVIAVDLFGAAADYDAIHAAVAERGLWVMSDSAQGLGCQYNGLSGAAVCKITTASFFPAKPLGCYGDGGAVLTTDAGLASLVESLRIHGKGAHKYENARIGMNSRLDTIQAAILLEKLSIFESEIVARNTVAARYNEALRDVIDVPQVSQDSRSIWAQYTLTCRDGQHREAIMQTLQDDGIPTAVYYPKPLHQQQAYAHFPRDPEGLSVSEALSANVFSLPMHPYLDPSVQDRIIASVRQATAN
ncbi:DegT/DnrJ/EryC1/StrS family aminotransferase [Altererythrobacter sp. CAU 1778]